MAAPAIMAPPIGASIRNKAARDSPAGCVGPFRETMAMHISVAIAANTVAQEKFANRIRGSGLPSPFADGARRNIDRRAWPRMPFPYSHPQTAPTGTAHPAKNDASSLSALRNPSERSK